MWLFMAIMNVKDGSFFVSVFVSSLAKYGLPFYILLYSIRAMQ